MSDSPETLPDVSGYRVDGVLGRGGFGVVYRATRSADGLAAAIKVSSVSDPSAEARLFYEGNVLRSIGPPAVPEVFTTGVVPGGRPFLAMELVALPTLEKRLADFAGPVPEALFERWAKSILRTVQVIHESGVIHRDVKPQNIFVDDAGSSARLIDFEIARAEKISGPDTSAEGLLGTAEYMAPEQCEGREDLDVRVDLYALGVIFYQMLTGRRPFEGTAADLRQAHMNLRPPPPSQLASVPRPLEVWVMRCLEKERARRFESAGMMREALDQTLNALRASLGDTYLTRMTPTPGATASNSAPTMAEGPVRKKRSMALLFFESTVEGPTLQSEAQSSAGKVAYLSGKRCVFAYGDEVSDNPVRRAHAAADALRRKGMAERVLVDLAQVSCIQRRAGAPVVYSSPLFQRAEQYPPVSIAPGVVLTPAAAAVLPEVETAPLTGHPLWRVPSEKKDSQQVTVVATGAEALFGQKNLLASLLESAKAVFRGPGLPTMATVIGETGYGKSSLASAVLLELQAMGGKAWTLRAREASGGHSQEVTRELLRLALALPSAVPEDAGKALLTERLPPGLGAEAWAAVALALGWLDPAAPELKSVSAAPGLLRALTVRATGEALRRTARSEPLLVVLDDAHLADDLALDALEYATLDSAGARIWACVLARPTFSRPLVSWGERSALRLTLQMEPLDAESAADFCRFLLRPVENVPASVVTRLVEQTRGVPLFLVELVRGLKNVGIVRQSTRGGYWVLAAEELDQGPGLPLVEWIAGRELGSLSLDLKAHLQLSAQLGPDFTVDILDGVLRQLEAEGRGAEFPLDARVGLRRLTDKGLMISDRDGRHRFRTALVRDAVSRDVPEALKLTVHRAAFKYLDDNPEAAGSDRLARRAFHAEGAGYRDVAAALYLEMAADAQSRHAYLDAQGFYSRALEQFTDPDTATRLRMLQGRGLARYRGGRYDDAIADLGQARELARALQNTERLAEILLDESTALDWMNEYRKSKDLVDEASELLGGTSPPALAARLSMSYARSKMRFSDYVGAVDSLQEAVRLAEAVGDEAYETKVVALLLLGPVLASLGRTEEAGKAFDKVTAICAERGDRLHLASAVQNRIVLDMALRRLEDAVAHTSEFLQIVRELGLLSSEGLAEQNLAELHHQSGNFEAALLHVDRATIMGRRLMGERFRPDAVLLKVRILFFQGNVPAARELCEELQRSEETAAAGVQEALLMPSDRILLKAMDLATRAETSVEEWQRLIDEAKQVAVQTDPVEVVEICALTLLRAGDRQGAANRFREALAMFAEYPGLIEERLRRGLASALAV